MSTDVGLTQSRELQDDICPQDTGRIIGMHGGLKHVTALASLVAAKPTPVLLLGETGTGKEVIAGFIHRLSKRSRRPFVGLNCGAVPESLLDSELFGYEKGAFTGADERKPGKFERADGGTLFLDEIAELSAAAQVKLLRVLQEKEFEPVGGERPFRADVRLIAATNRDLREMVRRKTFREDLWFRLNVFPIFIPPLRERKQDIPELAEFFIQNESRRLRLPFRPAVPSEEMQKLMSGDWPGNVRELQNTIERALILSRGGPLRFSHVDAAGSSSRTLEAKQNDSNKDAPQIPHSYEQVLRLYFNELLTSTRGKIAGPDGAAEVSGLKAGTLRSKLQKLGIDSKRFT